MLIVFYVSSHGFGHASRASELIEEILRRRSDVTITLRTAVRPALFDRLAGPRLTVEQCDTDPGVAQIDSLTPDIEETGRRAATFYREFDRRVAEETVILRARRPAMVIADVPPLAVAAAHRAGVRAIVVSNFTWDWIYSYYPEFEPLAPGVAGTIADAYSHADLALRLPTPGGFASMSRVVRDIPFIARHSRRDRDQVRRLLGIDGSRTAILASFGGYGVALPFERVAQSGLMLLSPDDPPPGLQYEDLVAAVDVVVSKPGYGIVSECIANGTPLLYTSRGRFAEYPVMLAEMPKLLRCRYIRQEDFLAGRWKEDVEALLAQKSPAETPRTDGAAVAAEILLEPLG